MGIDLEKYWWHMKYYKDKSLSSFCLDSNKKIKKCFLACASATRPGGTFSNKMGTSLCGGHDPCPLNGMGLMLLPEVSGNNSPTVSMYSTGPGNRPWHSSFLDSNQVGDFPRGGLSRPHSEISTQNAPWRTHLWKNNWLPTLSFWLFVSEDTLTRVKPRSEGGS